MSTLRVALLASPADEAQAALAVLSALHPAHPPQDADVIVALGGDGFMLQTLHRFMNDKIPIYGMNRGSVGFLMNDYAEDQLCERLRSAEVSSIRPSTIW